MLDLTLKLRALYSLHQNAVVATHTLDGPLAHPGIAGGTGIGYGEAVHSYRLQAKQRGNTMKRKTKSVRGEERRGRQNKKCNLIKEF